MQGDTLHEMSKYVLFWEKEEEGKENKKTKKKKKKKRKQNCFLLIFLPSKLNVKQPLLDVITSYKKESWSGAREILRYVLFIHFRTKLILLASKSYLVTM